MASVGGFLGFFFFFGTESIWPMDPSLHRMSKHHQKNNRKNKYKQNCKKLIQKSSNKALFISLGGRGGEYNLPFPYPGWDLFLSSPSPLWLGVTAAT